MRFIKLRTAIMVAMAISLALLCIGCGSSNTDSEVVSIESTEVEEAEEVIEEVITEAETAEDEETISKEGKSSIDVVGLMEAIQEELDYTLEESQKDFITEHINLFPADKDDLKELYSYYDPELDYAHIKKNPQKYCGSFAYLGDMVIYDVGEVDADTNEYGYYTIFYIFDRDGNGYYINYVGKSVDVVEGDSIRVVAMPIANNYDEDIYGNSVTTIIMLASIVEDNTSPDLLANFSTDVSAQSETSVTEDNNDNSDYILPDSDSRYYSDRELINMSKDDLRKARNEIYARHGRIFDSSDLDEYFRSKSWYEPTIPAAQFSDNVLNDYEKANARTIQAVENPPVEDMSKQLNGANFYGEYIKYDESGRRIDVVIDADGESDKITFTDPRDESIVYSGRMDYENGNVFTTDGLLGRIRCIVGDSALYVEILYDPYDTFSRIEGICPLIKRYDFTHTG